jgi:hypothetical protein
MPLPDREAVRRLLGWHPAHGVVSIYLEVDHGDRGESWRIELRNGLRDALRASDDDGDHELKAAMRATAGRIERRSEEGETPPSRAEIGFCEVMEDGRDIWHSLSVPVATEVVHDRRPHVHPLLGIIDAYAPRGVAVISSERVRLLGWSVDGFAEIADSELEAFILDWRERKAQGPRDPARGQATSASGHDQYGERLEHERGRFLTEAGRQVAQAAAPDWREVLAFGATEHFRQFAKGFQAQPELRHAGPQDLISQPDAAIRERVEEILPELNREREARLVDRAIEEARGGARGSLGVQETAQALAEGRVERLLFDAERAWEGVAAAPELALNGTEEDEARTLLERLVDRALETSAEVTPLTNGAAEPLADSDGIAALLRY